MATSLLSRDELMEMAAAVPADPVVPGQPITGKMRLGDILAAYPAAAAVVSKYGLHCSGCHANVLDTLDVGARGHGLGEVEIRAMVWEINQAARGKPVSPAPASAKASDFCSFIGNPDTVNLTGEAAARLRETLERRRRPRYGVRIGIHKEGPAGYIYYVEFERKPKKTDVVLKEKGFKFFVDSTHAKFIKGIHIAYESGFEGEGFRFTNPNLSNADFLKRRSEAPLPPPEAAPGGPAGEPPARGLNREAEEVPAEFRAQRYRNMGL